MEVDHQREHLGDDVTASLGAPQVRRDGLLDHPDLPVGRHLEGAQVAAVHPVVGQSLGRGGQGQGVPAVVGGAPPRGHDAVPLQLHQCGLGQTARLQQVLARQPQRLPGRRDRRGRRLRLARGRRVAGRFSAPGADGDSTGVAPAGSDPGSPGRGLAPVDQAQVLADHLQRQVVVPLHRQHVAQPFDVGLHIAPVARRGPFRASPAPRSPGTGSWRWRCPGSHPSGRPAPGRCCVPGSAGPVSWARRSWARLARRAREPGGRARRG